MSRTFTNLGYTVTVEDDRSILVKPGDWISKYAGAIYGSVSEDYWGHFVEKVPSQNYGPPQYRQLDDPNLIRVGQRVYHPGPLPGEPNFARRPRRRPRTQARKPGATEILQDRVVAFFNYAFQVFWPVTDWRVAGTTGGDGGISFVVGQYIDITLQHKQDGREVDFHGIAGGLSLGLSDFWCSLSVSPPTFSNWASAIGKFSWAGATLSEDEICGNYLAMDIGAGILFGASASVIFFGANAPLQAAARTLGRYLQGGSENALVLPSLFRGMIWTVGPNLTFPDASMAVKLGIMHQWSCLTGR